MRGRFRPPAPVVAAALLGLIALLATLQYRWLGRISDAERDRLTATLDERARAFALDFDREVTLAYILFQVEPTLAGGSAAESSQAARITTRYERWQAAARYPKLIREVYLASREGEAPALLQRFNLGTHALDQVEWPQALQPIHAQLGETREDKTPAGTMVVRTMTPALWEEVPAIVVPSAPGPLLMLSAAATHNTRLPSINAASYTILVLDRQVMTSEMLPAIASTHFQPESGDIQYQVAVLDEGGPIFRSTPDFTPEAGTRVDASAALFQVRPQEFPQLLADVRRFTALALPGPRSSGPPTVTFSLPVENHLTGIRDGGASAPGSTATSQVIVQETRQALAVSGQAPTARDRGWITTVAGSRLTSTPKWRLMVKHPAGSLEAAVDSVRRRNLMVSMGILGVLAASMMLMVVSMRRSQELARQQMEFVATVSHELRTPLAVVRAAGDNLADGVVLEREQVQKYGELVRSEGRRLTEMVEQILELAGMQSGQRSLNLVPIRIDTLLGEVLRSSATLITSAGLEVEVEVAADLPPVPGDEAALRRAFQNLVGNAIKYGADGGWIGVTARRAGSEVAVTVSDRGIGIAPADQERIFDPFFRAADVVSAQVQGAGLGLSLVQRIIQAHHGRVTVKSAKAAGSEFTVHLPAATAQAAGQPATVGPENAAPASHLS